MPKSSDIIAQGVIKDLKHHLPRLSSGVYPGFAILFFGQLMPEVQETLQGMRGLI